MNSGRAPPPQGPPPSYAFVGRVYKRSLRPVVLFTTFIDGLWSLLWAISAFRVINFDKQHLPKLTNFSIALGAIYMASALIEGLGLTAATTQRLALIRMYAFASFFSALCVIAAGFIRVVTHFTMKHDLISTCATLIQGDTVFESWGFWGGVSSHQVKPDEANQLCQNAWDHDSWSEIVSLLIEIILGLLFSSIAFAYYHQALDPTSVANFSRAPSNQVRMDAYPTNNYSMPYLGYNRGHPGPFAPPAGPPPGAGVYAPPAGPPPGKGYSASELPAYEGGSSDGHDDKKENPFEDFEEAPLTARPSDHERDVTSPRTGYRV